jgi:hypothetical protein
VKDLKKIETMVIETTAAAYGRSSVDDLIAQQQADIKRLAKGEALARTPEAIRDQLQAILVVSIELMAEHCNEERWRRGIEGAILEGRISILRETLDWIGKGQ